MTDREPIDTKAALSQAWSADRASREDESWWIQVGRTAREVREQNHFRHTWARHIRTWHGPNDQD